MFNEKKKKKGAKRTWHIKANDLLFFILEMFYQDAISSSSILFQFIRDDTLTQETENISDI
jgi:hypothetical protein